MAAPSKFTKRVRETILRHLRLGAHRETACARAGINERTFYIWREKAAAGQVRFAEFFDDIAQAEAEREGLQVAMIMKAAAKDWKAAAWLLTHGPSRHRFGDQPTVVVNTGVDFTGWSEAKLKAYAEGKPLPDETE